jgi:hypothetical protein
MKPTHGRRAWFKVFVNDWLEGTTRYQMSDAQRAFWIDLLAMAGRSRFGGIVCSGKDGEQLIGYPLLKFQGLLAETIDVEATFALFERTEKITMQVSSEGSRKLYVIFITNWARYQSEYARTKQYRKATATTDATDLLQTCYAKGNKTEVEGEVEGEVESVGHDGPTDRLTLTGKTWKKLKLPFLPIRFQGFVELVEENPLSGNIVTWGKRILDLCDEQGIEYPKVFLKRIKDSERSAVDEEPDEIARIPGLRPPPEEMMR